MIHESPDIVQRMTEAMVEAVHFYKNNKEDVMRIMQKYSRGQKRSVLEGTYTAYRDLFVEDTYPTSVGLRNTLEVQASWDPKAVNAKAKDFVDLRFVDRLKKSGFIDKLYGRSHASR